MLFLTISHLSVTHSSEHSTTRKETRRITLDCLRRAAELPRDYASLCVFAGVKRHRGGASRKNAVSGALMQHKQHDSPAQ